MNRTNQHQNWEGMQESVIGRCAVDHVPHHADLSLSEEQSIEDTFEASKRRYSPKQFLHYHRTGQTLNDCGIEQDKMSINPSHPWAGARPMAAS